MDDPNYPYISEGTTPRPVPDETILDEAREIIAALDDIKRRIGLTERECAAVLKLAQRLLVNRAER